MARTPTRTIFLGMMHWEVALFYVLSVVSTGVFVWGCYRLFRRYQLARIGGRRLNFGRGLRIILTHSWISRRSGLVGIAHAGVFY